MEEECIRGWKQRGMRGWAGRRVGGGEPPLGCKINKKIQKIQKRVAMVKVSLQGKRNPN